MLDFYNKDAEETLQNFSDPFSKGAIKSIQMDIRKNTFTEKVQITGVIRFRKLMTQGTQRFEADSFPALVKQIDAFIKNI